ncbi:Lactate dehydrogenase [Rhizobiales bacterium GAS191]|jgi:lactate dehydrogenase-like 2-hydroxyacid dehydrogenase|nr:Lactate dehydrogenase [Rhizobiales bacterium GAS191]SEE55904.1 Lactate dehydrogenase [Rhizobiales bacterium GAS188]
MTETVDIVLTGPLPGATADGLDNAFHVYRPFTGAEQQAKLEGAAAQIRGVAAGASHEPLNDAFFDLYPKLEILASCGVGYDHIDAKAAAKRGIIVTNTPDVLTEEVADTALGLLISTIRRLPQADAYVRAGKWLAKPFPFTDTLRGKSMGIAGLGRIGKAIARRAEAFGIGVSYHSRSPQRGVPYPYYPTLEGMAQAVDILMVITPGGAATRHLINARILEALGPHGTLINMSRGSVVDEQALIAALKAGKIASAGLDVFENEPNVPQELIAMENVVLLPHVGSASVHTRNAMGNLVVDNLKSWFSGKGPLTPVVETPWPRQAKA